ncbi:MAG: hypothetical protein QOE26_533 [Verrucomicrobiota bacterium]|jgi:hypothetical protein
MNKTALRSAILILVAASLGACATSSATKPANPQVLAKLHAIDKTKATIVVYRPREYLGAALRPTVVLDGKDLVNIGNGKVFVASLSPGHHTFEMDDKKSGTTVDLKPGEDVYLKIEIVPGFWKGGGKMTQVAPQQGNYEATRLDLIELKEIEDARFR